MKACVYVIESSGAYKIGVSDDPFRRMETLQAGTPNTLSMLMIIRTDDAHRLEARLHNYFARKRIRREWFDLSAEDIAYLHQEYDAVAHAPLPIPKKERENVIRSAEERRQSRYQSVALGLVGHLVFSDPLLMD